MRGLRGPGVGRRRLAQRGDGQQAGVAATDTPHSSTTDDVADTRAGTPAGAPRNCRWEGMTCAACVARVEKALAKTPGVAAASVNFATEKASVTFDPTDDVADTRAGTPAGAVTLQLPVEGMTCAACVARVEKALAKTPGVAAASVNFATEKVLVQYMPGTVTRTELRRAVESAGYGLLEEEGEGLDPGAAAEAVRTRELRILKIKLTVSLVAGALLMLMMFFPPPFLTMAQSWLVMLILATPVQVWAGWQFYRGAWAALKHRTSDMNTLIAVGTSAAYVYSTVLTIIVLAGGSIPGGNMEAAATAVSGSLLRRRDRGHVLRFLGRDHRTDPIGSFPGGQGQGPHVRCHEEAHGSAGPHGARGARRCGVGHPRSRRGGG